MQPRNSRGMCRRSRDRGDRERRGVRRQDAFLADHAVVELAINVCLASSRSTIASITRSASANPEMDSGSAICATALSAAAAESLAFRDQRGELLGNQAFGVGGSEPLGVEQAHIESGLGHDLRDAAAHRGPRRRCQPSSSPCATQP